MANSPAPKGDVNLSKGQKAAGYGLAALGGVAALAALYVALPFLLTIAWGIVNLGIAVGIILLGLFLATDKTIKTIVGRLYRQMIWKLWWKVMTYDPIASLKESIAEMEKRFLAFKEHRKVLRGQITSIERAITANEDERNAALKRANAARGTANADRTLTAEGTIAGRRKSSNEKLKRVLATFQRVDTALAAAQENLEYTIGDAKDRVDVATREFIATQAGGAAVEEAMAMIEGDPELKRMFADTMSYIDTEVSDALGRVDLMVEDTAGVINSINVQKGVYKQEALEQLEQWGTKSTELRLPGNRVRVEGSSADASVAQTGDGTDANDDARSLFADDQK